MDDLATGECDEIALVIGDGEHEAIAEADVEAATLVLRADAGIDEFAAGEFLFAGPVEEDFGVRGHPANAPAHGHFLAVAARFQVGAGVLGAGIGEEQIVHESGGLAVEIEQAAAAAFDALAIGIEGVLDDGDVCLGGELAHGIHEGQSLMLHHKGEGIPALTAAEAFERLALGVDVEGWGFFVVKGAIRLEGGARAFHRDIGGDEVHDIDGL